MSNSNIQLPSNIKVGHYTDSINKTGLTVFLLDKLAGCKYLICGSAPATRELASIDIGHVPPHALLITGGSAYGLNAANGVMQWLAERNIGYPAKHQRIPIVPTAAIYDFGITQKHYPREEHAYLACKNATSEIATLGQVGAGTGAFIGTLVDDAPIIPGGLGAAKLEDKSTGCYVLACAVVNSVGDIIDDSGKVLAGRMKEMTQVDNYHFSNTTLVTIVTNAVCSDRELTTLCKRATSGMARAIEPAFTHLDGDIIFIANFNEVRGIPLLVLGNMVAHATKLAIRSSIMPI